MDTPDPSNDLAVTVALGGTRDLSTFTVDQVLIRRATLLNSLNERRRAMAADALAVTMLERDLLRRCTADNGVRILHPDFVIELRTTKSLQRNDAALLELKTVQGLSPEEVEKAVCYVTPEPQLKTNATEAKKLAKLYGGEVAKIVDRAFWYAAGPPTLFIGPKGEGHAPRELAS